MSSFDPFQWLYSILGYFEELWQKSIKARFFRKSSRSAKPSKVTQNLEGVFSSGERFRRSFIYRSFSNLFARLSLIPTIVDSSIGEWFRNSSTLQKIGKPFSFVFHFSFVEPVRWLVQLVGLGGQWLISRSWKPILLTAVPSILLLLLMSLVWFGGRLNRRSMANWYRQLGEAEIQQWEEQFVAATIDQPSPPTNAEQPSNSGLNQNDSPTISPYGEMLFRRVQLLEPSQRSQLIIASTMLQRGALSSGQNVLRKLAPDDTHRDPRAHSMMAYSYLIEFQKTRDPAVISAFRHHAKGAMNWSNTPKEVLLFAADLDWRSGDVAQSLRTYQIAAERYPEVNVLLFQRAINLNQTRIAELAYRKAIEHYQRLLDRDPRNEQALIDLALLLGTSEQGAAQAEAMLNEAHSMRPSPALIRALSELYRIQFVSHARNNQDSTRGFQYLDKAMVLDPSNPNVAENISAIMNRNFQEDDRIGPALNGMLASGRATTGTHALLAEYHLAQGRVPQAITHLEQVFQVAPTAVKFANRLAESYLQQGELEKAFQTAQLSFDLLEASDRINERFVDDLLSTMANVHRELGQFSEAIEKYRRCLELNPNRLETRRQLAALHRQLGDEPSAQFQENMVKSIEESSRQIAQYDRSSAKLATTAVSESFSLEPEQVLESEDLPDSPLDSDP